jgi:thiamine biosynthesis lipoprotein
MGTVISLDLRDDHVPAAAVDAAFTWFHDVDARFSTYRQDSEVSRMRRGTVTDTGCSADMREVLAICDAIHRDAEGAFDVHATGFDPSAVVKGWSVDRAVAMLEHAGARNFSLSAGGDIVARGQPEPGRTWRIGIRHPDDADKVAAVIAASNCAVATSGAYERGEHIIDPRTGRPATGVVSMTVVGPLLAYADGYSTAAYVMGEAGVSWVAHRPGHEAYAITPAGRALFTAGFGTLRAAAA